MLKFLFVLCLSFAAVTPSAEASSSVLPDRAAPRLFHAVTSDGAWTAGLEIALGEGWKTYWRMPGESGIPPQFDWSGSTNLKSITIGWPAPRRYRDAAGETVGYTTRIVFPLRVEPVDAAKPVNLALSLFYAVCKDICIPADADLRLEYVPARPVSPGDKDLLEQFAARVPASDSALLPAIEALRLIGAGREPVLEIALTGSLPLTADMFVEGHPAAYFRKPRPAQPGDKAAVFHLPIDGLQNVAELRGRRLTVTVVSGAASLVQSLTVE
jgi:DsbC/DsbD-like thiol-disulfide interchange protein